MCRLTVGSGHRIANQFPTGDVVWITGEYEIVDRSHRLVEQGWLGCLDGLADFLGGDS
jgi:hypothetical protein